MSILEKISVCATGFLLIAVLATELVGLAANLIFAPFFGMRVTTISFFGLEFTISDNKWTKTFHKLSPIIQYDVRFDSRKPVESFSDKKADMLQLVTVIAKFTAAGLICLLFRGVFAKGALNMLNLLIVSFAAGMVFHALFSLGIYLYTNLVLMKRLGGYINTLLKRLRQGESFASLDMKPVEELGYKNPTKTERLLYYQIYMGYLAAVGNYDGMRGPSHQAMNFLMDREYFVQDTGSYYWLIFFFSEIEPNISLTDMLLKRLGDVIKSDKDANAKRVLAYYFFNIRRDFISAQQMVDAGFKALDSNSGLATERELERQLLNDLNERLQLINQPVSPSLLSQS
ncbi:MAG: hypothetical protein IKW96_06185 [Ruminococcus sp.]|uniref:hypothetical protein n=1 Tax=Ruminococcus sp. TaxID=41978 RepID=UPI0025FF10F9|nr:hypothetical protein [Ruminococcus sp.]MBR5682851.1 hypothetical protein [Ruminococcus sp.]